MSVRPRVTLSYLAAPCIIAALSLAPPAPLSASGLSFSAAVVVLTNAERRSIMGAGCPDLLYNPALTEAAERHAADMARRNYFGHTSRTGASPWQRIRRAGYNSMRAAENIAAGQATPADVVQAWMESPGHRANILDCRLRDIGVGFARNERATYGNYWVQDLGTRR